MTSLKQLHAGLKRENIGGDLLIYPDFLQNYEKIYITHNKNKQTSDMFSCIKKSCARSVRFDIWREIRILAFIPQTTLTCASQVILYYLCIYQGPQYEPFTLNDSLRPRKQDIEFCVLGLEVSKVSGEKIGIYEYYFHF